MAVAGILKKEGACKRKKRGLTFSKTINLIQEFDEDLPVLTITQPEFRAPYDPDDNDDDIVYWWEEEEEIIPWHEMEDESEIRGYRWDDVSDVKHSKYRTNAMDGLLEEWSESTVSSSDDDGSSSDSDSASYDEETVSDEDTDYLLPDKAAESGIQLDVEALKTATTTTPPRAESALSPKSPRTADVPLGMDSSNGRSADVVGSGTPNTPRRSTPRRTSRASSLVVVIKEAIQELAPPDISQAGIEVPDGSEKEEKPAPAPPMVEKVAPVPVPAPVKKEEVKKAPAPAPAPIPAKSKLVDSEPMDDDSMKRTDKPSDAPTLPGNPPRPTQNKKEKKERGDSQEKRSSDKRKKKRRDSSQEGKKEQQQKKKNLPKPQPRPQGLDEEEEINKYTWEKPDWTKNKLKETKKGRAVRNGANLAKPITMINREKNDMMDAKRMSSFGRPHWTRKADILKETEAGDNLKSGANLARNITHIASDPEAMQRFAWEKPDWAKQVNVRKTIIGEKIKKGECISKGITHIREDEEVQEKYAWEKPEWAKKKVVKDTVDGQKMKKGEYLSSEITNNEKAKEKYGWEQPAWVNQVRRTNTMSKEDAAALKKQRDGKQKRTGLQRSLTHE